MSSIGWPDSVSPCRLQVLEACVKNCGHRFHVLVSTREFIEAVLVRAIIPRNNPPLVLHDRVLSLIQVSHASCDLSHM
jgi:hypothetical protein